MQPKSLSATAISVAELCMMRYEAEHIQYSRGIANNAASLGSAVHGALEPYVKKAIMEKANEPTLGFLTDLFKISYMTTFGTADINTEEFADGLAMLKAWHERTDFTGVTVLSCESKENFPIPSSIGEIPYNYIYDRLDQIGEGEYKVVDYKTNRWGLRPEDLRNKIQARSYALAAQIKFPDAKRIWVEFDMLRHDGPIGIVFSREENAATYRFIKAKAQEIVDTTDPKPTLNPECLFCSLKQTCPAIMKNISTGGLFAVVGSEEAIDRRAELEWQKKAVESAIKELDSIILSEAKELDQIEFESDTNRLKIGVSSMRSADAELVELCIGSELFAQVGGKKITMSAIDKLLKGNDLTPEKKTQLKGLIYRRYGEPSVKVEPKNPIDGD